MKHYLLLPLLLLCCFWCGVAVGQSTLLKKMDAANFYAGLGAKYVKAEQQWQLPATAQNRKQFENGLEGPLSVRLDSMVMRPVGGKEEAWVLFTVSKVIYNFARFEKTPNGWQRKALHYRVYEGTPGEYSADVVGFVLIGSKTFINILETYYGTGISTTNWVLIDPFDFKKRSSLAWARTGEKDQSPTQYEEYTTQSVQYITVPGGLPTIVLTQETEIRLKGQGAKKAKRILKYRYDAVKKEYVLE
jgi:hypothetical protein